MANIYKLQAKYDEIQQDMVTVQNQISRLENEYAVLTDQYMNGNIPWDIGKDQRRIEREVNKLKKQYSRLVVEHNKIYQTLQRF